MVTIIIDSAEISALKYITKPSSYRRLYSNLKEINEDNEKLKEYLSRKNYTMVDELYDKRSVVKQNLSKNQLTLLRLYQYLITAKRNDAGDYMLVIKDSLVPLLIETISKGIERIRIARERNYANKYEIAIEGLLDNILNKIENSTEGYKIYIARKELADIKNIIDFNDYLK